MPNRVALEKCRKVLARERPTLEEDGVAHRHEAKVSHSAADDFNLQKKNGAPFGAPFS